MDSQTFKITVFVGLMAMLGFLALGATGVTKDLAFAFGGKFGLTDKDDAKTFVTNPGEVNVKLTCERNQKQLENAQFLYKINVKDAKLQSEGKDDIRPVLYFKSSLLKANEGVISKDQVSSGNLPELNFELETSILPTYTKEFYTLFLLKKSDKCENALAIGTKKEALIKESVLVSQCSRDLLAKFDASTNSCSKDELPNIKIEDIETRVEKGVNECRPVFKVINNDPFTWTTKLGRGYKIIIRNCETGEKNVKDFQRSSGIKDVIIPIWPLGGYLEVLAGLTENPDNLTFVKDVFCKSGGDEKKIELYKECFDDIGEKEKYCTNLYRPELFTEFVPKPVLIQSVPFTC
jgi:hypothetical protein